MGIRTLARTAPLFGAQLVLACLCIALFGARASAQKSGEEIVTKLNSDALDAFNQLDINKAGAMLEEALRVAGQGGVSPGLIARTNLNMGIIYVSGLSDHDGGLPFFTAAICTDPQIQLDPLTSTPEVQSVYAVALQKAQGGACPTQGGAGGAVPAGPIAPVRPPPDQAISHRSPVEQLAQTPLPLYAEVHALAGAKKIVLFFKGIGMEQFKQAPMYQYQGGFAYQISCNEVWEPRISYYIEAHDDAGAIVGVAGSAAQPIEVPIVTARTQPEPALPQAAAPASCAASECPPGVKGCKKAGTAGIDETCDSDSDCQSGLECIDENVCRLIGSGSTEVPDYDESTGTFEEFDEPEEDSEAKRAFIQLGFAAGFSYLMQGMEADRPAPQNRVFMAQSGPTAGMLVGDAAAVLNGGVGLAFPEPSTNSELLLTAWAPDADSEDSIGPIANECPGDGVATSPTQYLASQNPVDLFPSSYCVRMRSTGFVPQAALRANIGYFITERIAASALFRFQLSSGEGTLAGILLGVRGEYLLTEPRAKGFMASAFLGATFGQIQAQPPADGSTDEAPFVVTGPLGVHVGSTLRYRFMPNFGLFVAPELDLQLPAVMFHIDATLGAEAAF
jgi:hypothetical protein